MADVNGGPHASCTLTLDECPDTVERCTIHSCCLIACGTYQLLEQDSESTPGHLMNRKGSLFLFFLDGSRIERVFSAQTEAILDCKWQKSLDKETAPLLCVADAKGFATLYSLQGCVDDILKKTVPLPTRSTQEIQLFEANRVEVAKNGLLLSLDWNTYGGRIIASDSNGFLTMLNIHSERLLKEATWRGHDFEAWITAFNLWDDNVIFSGGDDCMFCGWDCRSQKHIFKNSTHMAGVCSIQCNPNSEYQVATGSYDEYIRVWDSRAIRRKPLSEIFVGGGVWRLKWHPAMKEKLLAACMFNGFKVISYLNHDPEVDHSFNSSEGSLAYGVDWCPDDCGRDLVAGCTFYDRKLVIWNCFQSQ